MKEYFLIVVTRIKNENMMLRSFIPYYFSQGVDKIFLLDDSSSEEFEDIVINNPNVKIISVPSNARHPEWTSIQNLLSNFLGNEFFVIKFGIFVSITFILKNTYLIYLINIQEKFIKKYYFNSKSTI